MNLNRTQSKAKSQSKAIESQSNQSNITYDLDVWLHFDCWTQSNFNRLIVFDCVRLVRSSNPFDWDRLVLFWVNVFGFSERYMIEESPLKTGDKGNNFMRSYVKKTTLFLVKIKGFSLVTIYLISRVFPWVRELETNKVRGHRQKIRPQEGSIFERELLKNPKISDFNQTGS